MNDLSQHIALYSRALDLRVRRHELLASNIANADTPNYKARDFDFSAAMRGAMASAESRGGVGMAVTQSGHQRGTGNVGDIALRFRKESQSAADGNTVDMDVERGEMTENALQYQVLTQLVSDRFKGLRAAMSSTNS